MVDVCCGLTVAADAACADVCGASAQGTASGVLADPCGSRVKEPPLDVAGALDGVQAALLSAFAALAS